MSTLALWWWWWWWCCLVPVEIVRDLLIVNRKLRVSLLCPVCDLSSTRANPVRCTFTRCEITVHPVYSSFFPFLSKRLTAVYWFAVSFPPTPFVLLFLSFPYPTTATQETERDFRRGRRGPSRPCPETTAATITATTATPLIVLITPTSPWRKQLFVLSAGQISPHTGLSVGPPTVQCQPFVRAFVCVCLSLNAQYGHAEEESAKRGVNILVCFSVSFRSIRAADIRTGLADLVSVVNSKDLRDEDEHGVGSCFLVVALVYTATLCRPQNAVVLPRACARGRGAVGRGGYPRVVPSEEATSQGVIRLCVLAVRLRRETGVLSVVQFDTRLTPKKSTKNMPPSRSSLPTAAIPADGAGCGCWGGGANQFLPGYASSERGKEVQGVRKRPRSGEGQQQ